MPKVAVKIGNWYRLSLVEGGYLEGRVRSVSVPTGLMLNADGRHRIWIAGRDVEWFLRPDEVDAIEEITPPPATLRNHGCTARLPGHFRPNR
jgi:hypothetical protein